MGIEIEVTSLEQMCDLMCGGPEELTCLDCVKDGTDGCTRGAGRAVNDEMCEDFLSEYAEESEDTK